MTTSTETKLSTKERIRFALEDLPNRITIGFEVETQLEEQESELDTDGMRDHAEENVDMYDVCRAAGVPHDRDWIRALGCDSPQELADKLNIDWDLMIDNYVDNMDTDGWYIDDDETNLDSIGNEIMRSMNRKGFKGWNYCEDGSVSGPEFQSPIINGRDAAVEQAESFFSLLDDTACTIDYNCSCHIHIRMQDIYHTGHNILQQLIFEELFNDVDAMPRCVKDRCRQEPKWIQPNAAGGDTCKYKYNPIQRHGSYGTWEFRIFGNVSDAVDFAKCLDAAVAAMHRAYTRFLAGDRKELPPGLWADLAGRAMRHWTPIQDAPEFAKYWEKPLPMPSEDGDVAVEEPITESTPLERFRLDDGTCDCDVCLRERRRAAIRQQREQIRSAGQFVPVTAECV